MSKHEFQTEVSDLLNLMIHSLYSNKEISLIVSGIGKIKAALALGYVCSKLNPKKIISIGVCAGKKEFKISQIVNVCKIVDLETKKVFHLPKLPDFKNLCCATSSLPQTKPFCHLGDMEASSIYQSAIKLKKEIVILKVVSDYFCPQKLKFDTISKLIKKNINQISQLMEQENVLS